MRALLHERGERQEGRASLRNGAGAAVLYRTGRAAAARPRVRKRRTPRASSPVGAGNNHARKTRRGGPKSAAGPAAAGRQLQMRRRQPPRLLRRFQTMARRRRRHAHADKRSKYREEPRICNRENSCR